jgi:hypothetical protein
VRPAVIAACLTLLTGCAWLRAIAPRPRGSGAADAAVNDPPADQAVGKYKQKEAPMLM